MPVILVSLIQSLIPLVNDPIEAHDHIEKLKEINDKMQTMLPLMHFYMNIPTPPKESDKVCRVTNSVD